MLILKKFLIFFDTDNEIRYILVYRYMLANSFLLRIKTFLQISKYRYQEFRFLSVNITAIVKPMNLFPI